MKTSRRKIGIIAALITLLIPLQILHARELPPRLRTSIDSMITEALAKRAFPGASFAMGDPQGLLYLQNYGYHDYSKTQKVRSDDLYDVASCTKVLSTTFALMRMYDQGLINMYQTVGDILPQFSNKSIKYITIKELLTHTSGLGNQTFYPLFIKNSSQQGGMFSNKYSALYPYRVDRNLFMACEVSLDSLYISFNPKDNYRKVCENYYVNPAVDTVICNQIDRTYKSVNRGKYLYCDSNFYLLRLIIEQITGKELGTLTAELMSEIECVNSGYNPLDWYNPHKIIPTEEDYLLRRGHVQGTVHDELSALSGGVGGNSGLFSTAQDIAHFCEMILNGGLYQGRRVISKNTIQLFTSSPLASKGIHRAYGFDKRSSTALYAMGGDDCFGHTGFTGTMFWINRKKGIYMIFLSNSIHPTRVNNELVKSQLRAKLWEKLSSYF